jgi:hypothetical protein
MEKKNVFTKILAVVGTGLVWMPFWAPILFAVVLNAFSDVEPGSVQWAIAVGLLIVYSLAVAVVGVGGVLLLRDLFRPPQLSAKNL